MINFLDKLEEALKLATPGPWSHQEGDDYVKGPNSWHPDTGESCWLALEKGDASYIALVNPPNITKLLRVVRLAEQVDKFIVKPEPPGNAFAIRSELTEALRDLKREEGK